MPILSENKNRYPKNWQEIRAKILDRAGHSCEFCGVKNYEIVFRTYKSGKSNLTKIILTIAHLHPPIENCSDENLKALCQKCHLQYDMPIHIANRRKTLEKRKGATLWENVNGALA